MLFAEKNHIGDHIVGVVFLLGVKQMLEIVFVKNIVAVQRGDKLRVDLIQRDIPRGGNTDVLNGNDADPAVLCRVLPTDSKAVVLGTVLYDQHLKILHRLLIQILKKPIKVLLDVIYRNDNGNSRFLHRFFHSLCLLFVSTSNRKPFQRLKNLWKRLLQYFLVKCAPTH